jgi:hypothetical protein
MMNISILTLSAILYLTEYTLDRPQTVSFVLFVVLLFMLLDFIDNQVKGLCLLRYLACISILMIVWANMHGGYLVGQLILLMVLGTEGFKFLHHSLRPMSRSGYIGLTCIVLAGLFCSFLNPNHLNGIKQIFSMFLFNPVASTSNSEYISVFEKLQNKSLIVLIYYFFATVVFIVTVLSYRRIDITRIALLVCTGYFGFMHIRYYPFFLIAGVIFICQWQATGKVASIISFVVVLVTILTICLYFPYKPGIPVTSNIKKWVSDDDFPVSAADYLAERHAQGGIFSHYLWGGYLIWRLAPAMNPFIDGRNTDLKRFYEYSYCEEIIENKNETDNSCKRLFQNYGINYVMINTMGASGKVHPLLYSIGEDPDWELIYDKSNVSIFQRIK